MTDDTRTGEPGREDERQLGIFEDRILTVPNLISLVRLGCIPVFLWLLFEQDDRYAAAWLWAVVGATDWVDGWWARKFDVVSEFGKMIDPVTDRAVLIVGVVAVGIDGSVPWWLVGLTAVREVIVSIAVVAITAMGARRMDVTWWGKCATFGLYFAFPLLLAGASDTVGADWYRWAGWACAIPSLVYSYLSAAQYVPRGIAALRQGREDRRIAAEAGADPTRDGDGD